MRVSTFAQNNFFLQEMQTLQARIAERSIEVTTGKKSQRYDGIHNEAKQLVTVEATHLRISQFIENNTLIDQRLQEMETATGGLIDIASNMRTRLLQGINLDNANQMGLDNEAQALLDQVAALLNTEFNGRFLFAGSMTNTRPVDFTDPGFVAPPSVYPSSPNTTYYQGDTDILQLRVDPDNQIDYGITADNPAIEKLIRGLHLTSTAIISPVPDDVRLNEAVRVLEEALEDLPVLLSSIGVTRSTIETANKGHDDALLYAERSIDELGNADLTKAITLLTADQTTLEASFAALAQLSSVSLLNFLN